MKIRECQVSKPLLIGVKNNLKIPTSFIFTFIATGVRSDQQPARDDAITANEARTLLRADLNPITTASVKTCAVWTPFGAGMSHPYSFRPGGKSLTAAADGLSEGGDEVVNGEVVAQGSITAVAPRLLVQRHGILPLVGLKHTWDTTGIMELIL